MGGVGRGIQSNVGKNDTKGIEKPSLHNDNRPAMTYGSETWDMTKKEVSRLNLIEMRRLRWTREKTKVDHITNDTMTTVGAHQNRCNFE